MSAPIRTAVLGFGLAGKVFHCPFVSAVPGLELTAIVQRRGDEASTAYPSARILRSVEEAFSDLAIDLIVVGTPNDTHFELAMRALEAGKHVVIDKPFAATSAEARTLIDLAKQRNLVLAPFHNRRFDGDFMTLRSLLREGALGRVVTVESRFDRFRPRQRPNTWKEAAGPANGMLFDLGPHLVDQAIALYGVPSRITAWVRSDRDRTDIEDAFSILLEFSTEGTSGIRYTCAATMLAADPSPRFLAHGTGGSFRKLGSDPQEPALLGGAHVPTLGSEQPWLPESEAAWGVLTTCANAEDPSKLERTAVQTIAGDYRLFYASVRDAIQGAGQLAIPAADAFQVIRLLELARESNEQGRTLEVELP